MALTTEQRAELQRLKSEANSPKRELIRLMDRINAINPAEAGRLAWILSRLERWQAA